MDDIIFTRRSVRNYNLDKKLTYEELVDICRAGMTSPSARNQQPWRFLIIDDEEIINKMADIIVKSTMNLRNANTYIAVIGQSQDKIPNFGMEPCDLSASIMSMMYYARSKNLGTCWIGVSGNKEREDGINKVLNVGNGYFVFSLMAIGYPSDLGCFKEVDRFDINKIYHNKF